MRVRPLSYLTVVLVLTLAVPARALEPPGSEPLAPERLAALAARLGLDAAALESVESGTVTLLDGRRIERFKAFDPATGEVVGGAFDRGEPVDLREVENAAGAAWRAQNGALTPALVARLAATAPGERLPFAVWLDVDLAGVAERAALAPLRHESGTALNQPATADRPVAPARPAGPEVEKPATAKAQFQTAADLALLAERQAAIAREDAAHRAALSAAIAPAREQFLVQAAIAGVEVGYASEVAPMAVATGTREQIEALAFLPGIDALYDASGQGGPSLQYARPTQNVTPINDVGYDGTGVAVSVTEGERGFAANPLLTWAGFYDGGQPYANHPTAVGGMIRSSDSTQHGLAGDVSLYSANGSYSNFGTMSAAMDWGSTQARVLSNSWYWDSANAPDPWEADRHQDWFVRQNFDSVFVAAGNFGNGCGGGFSTYVVSPAKGNNILAIGNDDDVDSVAWAGDGMNGCSSFGDPHNSTGGTISKPEMSGVGTTITSTLPNVTPPLTGPVGSGTSYSTPMVAATAADIIEADANLSPNPEAVKAVLMATALHNIEGAARYSDVDGAGSLVGAAAAASAERGNWQDQFIDSTTSFPITKTQFAYAGERVRFVLAWSSNPNAAYTTDPLPADLDLVAYRADGTTVLSSSTSGSNSFEIVEFTAPASEIYQFRISLFSANWASGGTWMGTGWWRGEYRISPDTGYADPDAPPTGTHLAVYPTDWTPTNYWRAFGVRPHGTSDYDLQMADQSLFGDPGLRHVLAGSAYGSQTPDFVVVDGNEWPSSSPEHYRILKWTGSEGYDTGFSNLGLGAGNTSTTVTLGPVNMTGAEVVKVFDIYVPAYSHRRLRVTPSAGSADLGLRFFESDPGSAASWAQGRGAALVVRNRSASGTATERGGVFNNTAAGDWLGLVVEKFDTGSVTFDVVVEPPSLFSDGFEGGDTMEWSLTVL